MAAMSTLRNLSNVPANLIPLTNSLDCLATLMRLSQPRSGRKQGGGEEEYIETSNEDLTEKEQMMQYYACDFIATILLRGRPGPKETAAGVAKEHHGNGESRLFETPSVLTLCRLKK